MHESLTEISMQFVALTVLLSCVVLGRTMAAEPDRTSPVQQVVPKTAKERLSDKASDEQRVNDCKVPADRRTRVRPAICPQGVGS